MYFVGYARNSLVNPRKAFRLGCGSPGMTVLYGSAKPVLSPQMGPARGF
jgi:hypothetical protein